jgi:hypothetical protein
MLGADYPECYMSRKKILLSGLPLACAWLAGAGFVRAQEVRATIGGRVTDAQGALVVGAKVAVTSDDTNVKRETETNDRGNWIVQFLLPGHYRISVAASGFKTAESAGVELQAADNKQIDVQLEVGSSQQSVEVTAEVPLIDTTAATSGTVITTEQITEMPTQSHVATLFATLSPGVIQQDQNSNVVHMWSILGASQFESNGGRNDSTNMAYNNSFQIDGMPDTQRNGFLSFIPPIDSIQEFRVQTNAYDASIGRQAGATINMQTRAGGKNYHGTLYEFNQNNFLNANLYQTNLVGGAVPPVHFNEYGGTFGGPVWVPKVYNGRERTFFFFSFNKTDNQDPRPGSTRSVPTALERTGDFSQSFTTQTGQRYPIQVFDPLTVDANGNRTLFPGMVIPKNRLSPIAQNILAYVPLPNTTGDPTSNASNNFVSSATRQDKFPVVSVRVDQNWSNTQHSFLSVRWSHLHEFIDDYFHNVATGNYQERIAQNAGLDHVWTMSSNSILNLRFSIARFGQPNYDQGSGFDPTKLGFPASFVSQLVKPSFPRIKGIAGDFGTNQAGTYYYNNYYTWTAVLTHVHGNHIMRYGGEYWVLQDATGSIGVQPEFDFDNSNWTRQNNAASGGVGVGSQFGSFLLGLPNGGNEPVNANGVYSQHFIAAYFQDDWRVTPRLTVNLGMRWDVETPVGERYNRLTSQFDLSQINPISASAQAAYAAILANPANASNTALQTLAQIVPASAFKVPGVIRFAGVNGQPRGYANADYHEWQPRAGFAYNLGRNTVIRGGFGRFTQASYQRGGQNGFTRTTSLVATQDNYLTAYDTLANPFRDGIQAPTGSSLGAMTNLGAGVDFNDPNPNRYYSWEYSLHLQHQIRSWLLEVGYSHNKTYGIWQSRIQDLPSYTVWKQLRSAQFDTSGKPTDQLLWDQQVPNPFYKLAGVNSGTIGASQTTALNRLVYSDPLLGSLSKNNIPLGKNQYDAMLVKVEHRFGHGFSILNSFTWSKLFEDTALIDGNSEYTGTPIVEHKLGGEDRPLHLTVSPIWELPFGRGKWVGKAMPKTLDCIVGGWELAGTYNIQSGVPVVFGTTSFFSGKGFALSRDRQSLSQWFDTSQFVAFPSRNTDISIYPAWTGVQNLPGAGYVPKPGDAIKNGVYNDFATYIRNYPTRWGDVRASRVNNLDLGVYKNIRFSERAKLQLRFDAFNALNHVRFPAPETDPTKANFGRVQLNEQNQARAVELGARLTF